MTTTEPADLTADQLIDTFQPTVAPPTSPRAARAPRTPTKRPPTRRTARPKPAPAAPTTTRRKAAKSTPSPGRRKKKPAPRASIRPKGSRRSKSTGRAQYGVRLTADLYQALRSRSTQTRQSYPAILGTAYNRHWESLLDAHTDALDDIFGEAPPLRPTLGPGARMVQFCLTDAQLDLLGGLAEASRQTFPATIRDLLSRELHAPT